MIPRIIHQIWLGTIALPEFTESWKLCASKNNYEYRLWREKEIDDLNLKWRKEYDVAPLLSLKSDIARIEILSRFGGFYFDCDFVSSGRDLAEFIPPDVHFVATTEHRLNMAFFEEHRGNLPSHRDSSCMALFIASSFLGASLDSRTIARAQASVGIGYEKCGPHACGSCLGPYLINASICEPFLLIPNCYTTNFPAPEFPHLSYVDYYKDGH